MPRFLYLPIEIAAREMDSRLLTALFAVRSGMEVLIGQKWLLQQNMAALPPGAFLFKTMSPRDYKNMRNAAKYGHGIFAIDEEMPGLGEGCGGLQWVLEQAVDTCDSIFLPGLAHFEAMQNRFPGNQTKMFLTGNPRWDLLRSELRGLYAKDAEALRERYKNFVLVNTNVGVINSAKGSSAKLFRSMARYGRLNFSLEKDRNWAEAVKKFQTESLEATISFVRRFSSVEPDRTIIIRPHPTEKLSTYRDAFKDNPRVIVIFEGPAAPWILAADVLVHTACTTANEAFALGVPAVCINTGRSVIYDYFISNKVSLESEGVEAAVRDVCSVLKEPAAAGKARTPKMKATFNRFFAASDGPFAAERMVEIMANGAKGLSDAAITHREAKFKTWRFRTRFQKIVFPDAPALTLENRIMAMAGQLNMDTKLKVEKCGQTLYRIADSELSRSGLGIPRYNGLLGKLF